MKTIRTMDFDAVAACAPLDRQASTVRDGSGDLWTPPKPPEHVQHWSAPPKPTGTLREGATDLTGRKLGRLTVIRFHGYSGKSTPRPVWLVRCVCGDYEVRRAETIKRNANPDDCCRSCQAVDRLRARSLKPNNAKRRRADEARLEELAGRRGA